MQMQVSTEAEQNIKQLSRAIYMFFEELDGYRRTSFQISRLFLNANPDELFKYLSKPRAFSFVLNAA